jgi:hypothetical protein
MNFREGQELTKQDRSGERPLSTGTRDKTKRL